jgi:preprotein translocase subunit SecY
MKKFIQTVRNIFAIEDLRIRILNTLGFLLIFRLGSYIVLPGVNAEAVEKGGDPEGILGLINTFSGGAFSNVAIFGLGIMPYITASIVLQLLGFAVPYFQKLQKEGESGRKKINQYTRVLTIFITLLQSVGYLAGTVEPGFLFPGVDRGMFTISSMIILTAGTVFCMWLGEKITDKGIGNGISMLIMVGIISRLPAALLSEGAIKASDGQLLRFVIELIVLFFVVMGVVLLTQGVRRIPVQYAKQVVGNKVYGGQRQYIPLKVIAAGVMPIIFAQSVMFLPAMLASIWQDKSDMASSIGRTFSDFTTWEYNLAFSILIILFTFFYTAIAVNPNQIADDMKRNGGFVPGVKPGKQTSEFIDNILSRITLSGSLFLATIAIMPAFANLAGISREFSYFYGGTSLLIMVGVILDTLQQIESHLLMRHYEGMMKSGRLKGRSQNVGVTP